MGATEGVTHFEMLPTALTVKFANGKHYTYSHGVTGYHAVEEMKRLALNGQGLTSYISRHKPQHASKK